jgi:MtN3 and saliva related transmembrane protein
MVMENQEIIGLVGMVCLVGAIYPQLIRLYRRKSSEDISIFLLIIMLIGSCFLITYAFMIDSFTYKLLEILFGIHVIMMLILVIKYRKKAYTSNTDASTG